MSSILRTGRQPRSRLVRCYMYHKTHVETDGEPLGYVRTVVSREKGGYYNIIGAIAALNDQMTNNNWLGATFLPRGASRVVPNIYITISPCVRKLYNFTALYKRHDYAQYLVYNAVKLCFDIPSRKEMITDLNTMIGSGTGFILAEKFQVLDCLTDAWANVGTNIGSDAHVWMHIKEMQQTKFVQGESPRELGDILDYGEPGDSYLRSMML